MLLPASSSGCRIPELHAQFLRFQHTQKNRTGTTDPEESTQVTGPTAACAALAARAV